jgi:outer membrane protein assembly factor BamE (lipoprotein component of BamABCDE complex)
VLTGFPERRLSAVVAGLIVAVSLSTSCRFGPVPSVRGGEWWRDAIANVLALIDEHDTEFAAEYTEEAFDSLRLGATRDDVERLLGAPLEIWERFGFEMWAYSKQVDPENNYLQRIVTFDSSGRLVEKHRAFYVD